MSCLFSFVTICLRNSKCQTNSIRKFQWLNSYNRGRSQNVTQHLLRFCGFSYLYLVNYIIVPFSSSLLVNECSVCYQSEYYPVIYAMLHWTHSFLVLFHLLLVTYFDIWMSECLSLSHSFQFSFDFSWFNECVYFMLDETFVLLWSQFYVESKVLSVHVFFNVSNPIQQWLGNQKELIMLI